MIEAARNGDAVAAGIVERGVVGLARIALGVAAQLFSQSQRIDVYPTGGIFGARDLVLEPFTSAVTTSWTGAAVISPRFSPAVGAMLRAAIDHGVAVDADFLDRVEATLPASPQERA